MIPSFLWLLQPRTITAGSCWWCNAHLSTANCRKKKHLIIRTVTPIARVISVQWIQLVFPVSTFFCLFFNHQYFNVFAQDRFTFSVHRTTSICHCQTPNSLFWYLCLKLRVLNLMTSSSCQYNAAPGAREA